MSTFFLKVREGYGFGRAFPVIGNSCVYCISWAGLVSGKDSTQGVPVASRSIVCIRWAHGKVFVLCRHSAPFEKVVDFALSRGCTRALIGNFHTYWIIDDVRSCAY